MLVFLTLVVPELVIAVSSLIFFVNVGYELGLVTMFLAHTVFNASLVLLIVRARFVSMGSSLEEASRDLGASALAHVPAGDAAAARAGDRGGRAAVVHVLVRRRRDLELHVGRRQRHLAAADPRPGLRFGLRPDLNAAATMMLGGHADRARGRRAHPAPFRAPQGESMACPARPGMPERRTGLVYDERCLLHVNPAGAIGLGDGICPGGRRSRRSSARSA